MTEDEMRTKLQDMLDEVEGLQYEDNPDVDMLNGMVEDIEAMVAAGIDDDNLATAAQGLLDEIDALIAKASAANDKSTARPIHIKALAENVTAVPAAMRRFRAVVTRSIMQTAIVEFDGPEGANTWDLAEEIVGQVPDDAWMSADPSGGWLDRIEIIGDAADAATETETDMMAETDADEMAA